MVKPFLFSIYAFTIKLKNINTNIQKLTTPNPLKNPMGMSVIDNNKIVKKNIIVNIPKHKTVPTKTTKLTLCTLSKKLFINKR